MSSPGRCSSHMSKTISTFHTLRRFLGLVPVYIRSAWAEISCMKWAQITDISQEKLSELERTGQSLRNYCPCRLECLHHFYRKTSSSAASLSSLTTFSESSFDARLIVFDVVSLRVSRNLGRWCGNLPHDTWHWHARIEFSGDRFGTFGHPIRDCWLRKR